MTQFRYDHDSRIRAMSPEEKLRVSEDLWVEAKGLMAAGVRLRHPDWTDTQVQDEVRKLMRDAGE
ncbi:MAG: hypothetical protein K2X99_00020 [Gemmatimonadaceae bacterium]|nr:hypothetical protein [Gemmatimonadaceae bacterium]